MHALHLIDLILEDKPISQSELDQEFAAFTISEPNAKIDSYNFNLRAGYTCGQCKFRSWAVQQPDGSMKVVDEPGNTMRCYAASEEVRPSVRAIRTWNETLAKYRLMRDGVDGVAKLMKDSITCAVPALAFKYFRIHSSGDFFSREYVDMWIKVAGMMPSKIFYAYTKAYPYFKDRTLPSNFRITHSMGGLFDDEIKSKGLKYAEVVMSEEEALSKGLEVDSDDSHAYLRAEDLEEEDCRSLFKDNKPFALLIHGTQPKGTEASKAVAAQRRKEREQAKPKKSKTGFQMPAGASILHAVESMLEGLSAKEAIERAAQAWCPPSTKNKVMDVELATAFADILHKETGGSGKSPSKCYESSWSFWDRGKSNVGVWWHHKGWILHYKGPHGWSLQPPDSLEYKLFNSMEDAKNYVEELEANQLKKGMWETMA